MNIIRWLRIARAVGVGNLPHRVGYLLKQRSGWFRWRLPAGEPSVAEVSRWFTPGYLAAEAASHWSRRADLMLGSPRHELRAELERSIPADVWDAHVGDAIRRLTAGEMPYFGRTWQRVGWPPRFNHDPVHGIDWPTGRHWTTYHQFDATLRDIKLVWEPSRFAAAFTLGRDAVRNPDGPAAPLFWEMLAAWDRQNPFGSTVAWANGQECAFRVMAWLFAAAATIEHAPPGAPQRLTELIAHSARLIDVALDYARGQKNNHAVSEAAVLWMTGQLFPELCDAARWRDKGRAVLIEEVRRQVYSDGSYVQHSVIYHRVMLDVCLWAMSLGRRARDPLAELEAPVTRALDWLLMMIEPTSGDAPNYGPNDGSRVLPLSCTDYRDFRPVAQALHALVRGSRAFPPGIWDEQMLWTVGPKSLGAPVAPDQARRTREAPDGGYFPMAGPRTWGVIRIHSYRDRPAQADMLHLDWWLDGVNVLRDGGTFMYHAEPPWNRWFSSTAAHNAVEVDRRDQMEAGPNFLWFDWTRARVTVNGRGDGVAYIEGEHQGYHRLPSAVTHRRGVLQAGDVWVVIDDLLGAGSHELTLRWRLEPGTWRIAEPGPGQFTCSNDRVSLDVQAADAFAATIESGATRGAGGRASPEGWESRYYGERTASPTIVVRAAGILPRRLVTIIGPAGFELPRVVRDSLKPGRRLLLRASRAEASWPGIEALSAGRVEITAF